MTENALVKLDIVNRIPSLKTKPTIGIEVPVSGPIMQSYLIGCLNGLLEQFSQFEVLDTIASKLNKVYYTPDNGLSNAIDSVNITIFRTVPFRSRPIKCTIASSPSGKIRIIDNTPIGKVIRIAAYGYDPDCVFDNSDSALKYFDKIDEFFKQSLEDQFRKIELTRLFHLRILTDTEKEIIKNNTNLIIEQIHQDPLLYSNLPFSESELLDGLITNYQIVIAKNCL